MRSSCGKIGSGDFDSDWRFDSSGEHVDPRAIGIVQALVKPGNWTAVFEIVSKFVNRAPADARLFCRSRL